jgi:hypothetical protein
MSAFTPWLPGLAALEELCDKHADKVNIRAVVRKQANAEDIQDLPIEVNSLSYSWAFRLMSHLT